MSVQPTSAQRRGSGGVEAAAHPHEPGGPAGAVRREPAGDLPSPRDGTRHERVEELAGMAADDPRRSALRDEVVTAHLGLVEHLARRYEGRGEPLDDLVQVGTIGLLKAVDRFDSSRGTSLAAYAVPTILGEIRRHFRDRGWAVRVPRRLQELTRTLTDVRASLTQELGRAPTVAELSQRAGLDVDTVLEGLESAGAYSTVPLEPHPDAEESWLGVDDDGLVGVENREALRPLLAALPARERRIIALRFVRGMSQSQIAAEVGLSQMHVSRLLSRSLTKLRAGLGEQ
jgi:RNA polymerase sigma-B factor